MTDRCPAGRQVPDPALAKTPLKFRVSITRPRQFDVGVRAALPIEAFTRIARRRPNL